MVKTITLRCSQCGKTYTFRVGAGATLTNWREALGCVADKKEAEKLMNTYMKISGYKTKSFMSEFSRNTADALNNVAYDACGEETLPLIEWDSPEAEKAYIGEKAQETITASGEKWRSALRKEGLTAFEAIYVCPKTRHPKQGLHLSLRWKDEHQRDNVQVCANKCDDCSTNLVLLDDGNMGFMHEDCTTTVRCESCNAPLVVDQVSFKIPQKDAQ